MVVVLQVSVFGFQGTGVITWGLVSGLGVERSVTLSSTPNGLSGV